MQDLNREFHSEIWAASGNKKMENMIAELWNGLSMGSMVTEEEYAGISIKEHEAIYEQSRLMMCSLHSGGCMSISCVVVMIC